MILCSSNFAYFESLQNKCATKINWCRQMKYTVYCILYAKIYTAFFCATKPRVSPIFSISFLIWDFISSFNLNKLASVFPIISLVCSFSSSNVFKIREYLTGTIKLWRLQVLPSRNNWFKNLRSIELKLILCSDVYKLLEYVSTVVANLSWSTQSFQF